MKNATKSPNAPKTAAAKAAAGTCMSKLSNTAGCLVDCKQGQIVLKLSSVNGTGVILSGTYGGAAVTVNSPTQITFTVKAGVNNLVLQYAIVAGDVGALFEDCDAKTAWDKNVNNTVLAVAYTVCA
jgi:hypothetical protein